MQAIVPGVAASSRGQTHARSAQARLDCAHRQVEHRRNLFVGIAMHIGQHHDDALVGWQGLDGDLNPLAQFGALDDFLRRRGMGQLVPLRGLRPLADCRIPPLCGAGWIAARRNRC